MYKLLNILFIIIILFFLINTYKYYFSKKNLKANNFNRSNIDQIIKDKISNLPILPNDTHNVIEFNDSFSIQINNEKPRSFWNLLKSK